MTSPVYLISYQLLTVASDVIDLRSVSFWLFRWLIGWLDDRSWWLAGLGRKLAHRRHYYVLESLALDCVLGVVNRINLLLEVKVKFTPEQIRVGLYV